MCLTQGDSASTCASPWIAPDFGAGCMARAVFDVSGERDALPVDTASSHLGSALEVLEHVGGTQLLATLHQPASYAR